MRDSTIAGIRDSARQVHGHGDTRMRTAHVFAVEDKRARTEIFVGRFQFARFEKRAESERLQCRAGWLYPCCGGVRFVDHNHFAIGKTKKESRTVRGCARAARAQRQYRPEIPATQMHSTRWNHSNTKNLLTAS